MNTETVEKSGLGGNVDFVNSKMPKNNEKYGNLKVKINTLLWEEMPEHTTIGQAEHLACEIFRLITGI